MWWNHTGWGSMYGWWLMPLFGLFCMGVFLFLIFCIFNHDKRGCGPFRHLSSRKEQEENELLNEIKELRRDVTALQKKQENELKEDERQD